MPSRIGIVVGRTHRPDGEDHVAPAALQHAVGDLVDGAVAAGRDDLREPLLGRRVASSTA